MSTRGMLVYYPGYPFDWEALTPQRRAASAAGALKRAGHRCVVYDYGTRATLERVTPPGEVRPRAWGLAGYVEVAQLNRRFRKQQAAHCLAIGESLATTPDTEYVAFLVRSADDALCVNQIARALKKRNAKMPIAAFGEFVENYGAALAATMPDIDWFCKSYPEFRLPMFAAAASKRKRWAAIDEMDCEKPDLRWSGSFVPLPEPSYDAVTYPSIAAGEKLLVFEVEDAFNCENGQRLRPVEDVCNHIWEIRAQYGTPLIRFTGQSTPTLHARGIHNGLRQRGVDLLYSRRQLPVAADPEFFAYDAANGCVLQSHAVHSGSQWLLDRIYRNGATITGTENVLRASRNAGITTVAEFTFPCPMDDYHTRDETLRLIRRTRPDAVSIRVPQVTPQSRWFNGPASNGIERPRQALAKRAMRCLTMYPLLQGEWERMTCNMRGRGASVIQQEIESLRSESAEFGAGVFAGEVAGLVNAALKASNVSGMPPLPEANAFDAVYDVCRTVAAAAAAGNRRPLASGGMPSVAGDGYATQP
jgi:hypothetical protein